jgi:DNA replication and repair protein RecF
MYISKLQIQNFRNIDSQEFNFDSDINFIVGENGSGKTSILEAIYFLSHGRSFRSAQLNRIIKHDNDGFLLFSKCHNLEDITIALSRKKNGSSINKLNYEVQKSHSEITKTIPIQLINPEAFNIINSGAKQRCKILDWGSFYLDKSFLKVWQQTKFLIKQRNSALKQNYPKSYISSLDIKLTEFSNILDYKREVYFNELKPKILDVLHIFNPDLKLDINYFCGWSKNKNLIDILTDNYENDKRYSVTNHGPHKADILLTINDKPIQDIFSRGQQKLLICAIKLAQGEIHNNKETNKCIYLIDDIASELDKNHLNTLFEYLNKLNSQIFITTTDISNLGQYISDNKKAINL